MHRMAVGSAYWHEAERTPVHLNEHERAVGDPLFLAGTPSLTLAKD